MFSIVLHVRAIEFLVHHQSFSAACQEVKLRYRRHAEKMGRRKSEMSARLQPSTEEE